MNRFEAIQAFWGSFGLTAYDETTVPSGEDRPEFPYITYSTAVGSLGEFTAMSASLWYYGTGWSAAVTKMTEIETAIGRGGVMLPCDGGAVWIKRGSPFAQRAPDPNDMLRRILLNIEAEFITA